MKPPLVVPRQLCSVARGQENEISCWAALEISLVTSFEASFGVSFGVSRRKPFNISVDISIETSVDILVHTSFKISIEISITVSGGISLQISIQISTENSMETSLDFRVGVSIQISVRATIEVSVVVSVMSYIEISSGISSETSTGDSSPFPPKPEREQDQPSILHQRQLCPESTSTSPLCDRGFDSSLHQCRQAGNIQDQIAPACGLELHRGDVIHSIWRHCQATLPVRMQCRLVSCPKFQLWEETSSTRLLYLRAELQTYEPKDPRTLLGSPGLRDTLSLLFVRGS